MATKVLTAHDLSTGSVLSSEIADVGDMVVHATISGATNEKEVKFSVVAKEGDGNYAPVRGENKDEQLNFRMNGNGDFRIAFNSVNSESAKIQVTVQSGADGSLTIETTKSANPLT